MASEMKEMTKHVKDYVLLYPYKELDVDDWQTYLDENGEWVPYSEGWREIGFKCPYPTVARLSQIRDLTSDMKVEDKSVKIMGGDPKRAAKFLVYNLIQDVTGLTNQGERVLYDKDTKTWLYEEFCKSAFLLSNFRQSYEQVAGKTKALADREESDFLEPSEISSSTNTKASTPTEDIPA